MLQSHKYSIAFIICMTGRVTLRQHVSISLSPLLSPLLCLFIFSCNKHPTASMSHAEPHWASHPPVFVQPFYWAVQCKIMAHYWFFGFLSNTQQVQYKPYIQIDFSTSAFFVLPVNLIFWIIFWISFISQIHVVKYCNTAVHLTDHVSMFIHGSNIKQFMWKTSPSEQQFNTNFTLQISKAKIRFVQ